MTKDLVCCDTCGKIQKDPMKYDASVMLDFCLVCWEKLPKKLLSTDIDWERIARYYINNVATKPDKNPEVKLVPQTVVINIDYSESMKDFTNRVKEILDKEMKKNVRGFY